MDCSRRLSLSFVDRTLRVKDSDSDPLLPDDDSECHLCVSSMSFVTNGDQITVDSVLFRILLVIDEEDRRLISMISSS